MNVEYWHNGNNRGNFEVLEEEFNTVPFNTPHISRGLPVVRNGAPSVLIRRLPHELRNTALNRLYFTCNFKQSPCCSIAHAETDGTRAETRFRLSPKRTSPFKSAGGASSVDYWQPRCAHQRW